MTGARRTAGPRLLIAGYYGYGNIWDEAILQSLLRDLGRELPDAEFLVLYGGEGEGSISAANHAPSFGAAGGKTGGPGVRYLPRLQPSAILAAMRASDLLVLGGGTLIQDVTSVRSLIYYLGLIWMAKRNGLPVAFYGGGIGPLTTALGRQLAGRVLPSVDLLALRDRRSIETARGLGVAADRLLLTADPAFSVPAANGGNGMAAARSASAVAGELAAAGVPAAAHGSVMCLALRPPLSVADKASIVSAVETASAAESLFPLLVPFHPERDLVLLEEIGAMLQVRHGILRGTSDPALLRHVVGHARLMVAMRLHGVIFAVAEGVPCVAMAYDPKVDALADDVPALRYARYPGVDAAQLAREIREAAQGGAALRAELERCASELGQRAAANARAVKGLLSRHAPEATPHTGSEANTDVRP